jgi:hypothetical protein
MDKGLRCPKDRYSEFIQRKPAGNLHHAVRLATAIGFPLNVLVTVNFHHVNCAADDVSGAFKRVRDRFSKWVTRPPVGAKAHKASPTFVWVLENPNGHLNAHWQLHVPEQRQAEIRAKVVHWISTDAGKLLDACAVHIREPYNPRGFGRYMLKGIHPGIAPFYGINPLYQGWVRGKRSGFSRNVGPTQKHRLRASGAYPYARRWSAGFLPSNSSLIVSI